MKKGEIYTGTVEKMDFPNKGILHIGEEKVVVKNALPGQTVEIAISKQRKGRCEGRLLKVVTPAAYENTEGACPHRADCGGCTYQTVPYEEQLKIKEQQVRALLDPVLPALFESCAMAVGLGGKGLLLEDHRNIWGYLTVVAAMTAGSALLMWIGERITDNGVGNGISIVLLINIVSGTPQDMMTLYERFMAGRSVAVATVSGIIVLAIIVAIVVFVLVLNDAERRIPVQYSKKMQGRRMIGGQSTYIPLKVNTANVIPVIFASSIMSMPVMIAQFFHVDYSTIGGKILLALSSSNWFKPEAPAYSIGMLVYIVLVVLFAYFYTSITFNPLEVANNMKKSGGFIPGIRPGKPTSDYLNNILNYIVFIGACGLVIVCIIPIIASGLFSVGNLSFGGTSLIIIAGVILETIKAVESMMLVRNYKGFLND